MCWRSHYATCSVHQLVPLLPPSTRVTWGVGALERVHGALEHGALRRQHPPQLHTRVKRQRHGLEAGQVGEPVRGGVVQQLPQPLHLARIAPHLLDGGRVGLTGRVWVSISLWLETARRCGRDYDNIADPS
jgi:hypothetical protein